MDSSNIIIIIIVIIIIIICTASLMVSYAPRYAKVCGCISQCGLIIRTRHKEVISFRPRPLYHRGKNPATHWIGGQAGSRVDLACDEGITLSSP
jgi:hypothetical protein